MRSDGERNPTQKPAIEGEQMISGLEMIELQEAIVAERHELRVANMYVSVALFYCTAGDWRETVTDADVGGRDPEVYLRDTFESFRWHVEELSSAD